MLLKILEDFNADLIIIKSAEILNVYGNLKEKKF